MALKASTVFGLIFSKEKRKTSQYLQDFQTVHALLRITISSHIRYQEIILDQLDMYRLMKTALRKPLFAHTLLAFYAMAVNAKIDKFYDVNCLPISSLIVFLRIEIARRKSTYHKPSFLTAFLLLFEFLAQSYFPTCCHYESIFAYTADIEAQRIMSNNMIEAIDNIQLLMNSGENVQNELGRKGQELIRIILNKSENSSKSLTEKIMCEYVSFESFSRQIKLSEQQDEDEQDIIILDQMPENLIKIKHKLEKSNIEHNFHEMGGENKQMQNKQQRNMIFEENGDISMEMLRFVEKWSKNEFEEEDNQEQSESKDKCASSLIFNLHNKTNLFRIQEMSINNRVLNEQMIFLKDIISGRLTDNDKTFVEHIPHIWLRASASVLCISLIITEYGQTKEGENKDISNFEQGELIPNSQLQQSLVNQWLQNVDLFITFLYAHIPNEIAVATHFFLREMNFFRNIEQNEQKSTNTSLMIKDHYDNANSNTLKTHDQLSQVNSQYSYYTDSVFWEWNKIISEIQNLNITEEYNDDQINQQQIIIDYQEKQLQSSLIPLIDPISNKPSFKRIFNDEKRRLCCDPTLCMDEPEQQSYASPATLNVIIRNQKIFLFQFEQNLLKDKHRDARRIGEECRAALVQMMLDKIVVLQQSNDQQQHHANLRDCIQLLLTRIHELFITTPTVVEIVHIQTYDMDLIRTMVEHVPSMHLVFGNTIDKLLLLIDPRSPRFGLPTLDNTGPSLVQQFQFGSTLLAYISQKIPFQQSLKQCQRLIQMLKMIDRSNEILQRIVQSVAHPLKIIAQTFPELLNDVNAIVNQS